MARGHARRDALAPNVRLMPRTQAFGYYAQNFVALNERIPEADLIADDELPRERLWQMRAREVVLAAGAIERPLVFPDNDRPGVMLAEFRAALHRQLWRQGRCARRHSDRRRQCLSCRAQSQESGRQCRADRRSAPRSQGTAGGCRASRGHRGHRRRRDPRRSTVACGSTRFASSIAARERKVACDALLMSGGWTPSVHLFSQSRGKLVFDEALQLFKPGSVGAARTVCRRLQRDLRSCGRARGRRCGWARGGDGGRVHRAGGADLRCQQRRFQRFGAAHVGAAGRSTPTVARRRSSISRTTFAPRT